MNTNYKFRRMFANILGIVVIVALAFPATGSAYAQEPNPWLISFPENDAVEGWEWPEGATVYLTIDNAPEDFIREGTAQVTTWGDPRTYVRFDFAGEGGYDLHVGDMVTLTDEFGTSTTHEVQPLSVTGVEIDTNVVAGTANVGAQLQVWAHGQSAPPVDVTASDGTWQADLTDVYDITNGTGGRAWIIAEGGNATAVDWYVPNPHFQVQLETNHVDGWEWMPNSQVTITINGTEAATVPTDEWGTFRSHFGDLEPFTPGMDFVITDGVSTKTLTTAYLEITVVDPDADTVSGKANAGQTFNVWVHGPENAPTVQVTADEMNGWTADFSGQWNIIPGNDGAAQIDDEDGDGTWVPWRLPNPHFTVFPEWEFFDGLDWPDGATVSISVAGKSVCDTSKVSWGGFFNGNFNNFDNGCNIEVGDTVTFDDGTTTRTHTVRNLAVTEVDKDANTVAGIADPETELHVWPHGYNEIVLTSGGDGSWLADFDLIGVDLLPGMDGRSAIRDSFGNETAVDWHIPKPRMVVFPEWEWFDGLDWPDGAVAITVDGKPQCTTTRDSWNYFFNGPFGEGCDVVPGDWVTFSAGEITQTHQVRNLAVTDVVDETNIVGGTADEGAHVYVWPHATGQQLQAVADSSGYWEVDFTGTFDLVPGSNGRSQILDEFDNATAVDWGVPWPPTTFTVNTTDDNDDGTCDELHCSLREAIRIANERTVADVVVFNIPGTPPFTIQPQSGFFDITDPLTIDATTQPGYDGSPVIELDGTYAGDGTAGLVISANDSTVRGLAINRFRGGGLVIHGNGNVVQGNYIGTDVWGTTATGPVGLDPENFTVTLETACPAYEVGTDRDGFISESDDPLAPWSGVSVTFMGTDEGKCGSPETFEEASLIYRYKLEFDETTELTSIAVSGAAFNGGVLRVLDAGMNVLGTAYNSGGNSFQTNYIVLDGVEGKIFYVDEFDFSSDWRFRQRFVVNGSLPLGNFGTGIQISNAASGNLIGGTDPADRNLISGNGGEGIGVYDSGTNNNSIQGNFIGTDVTGTRALPNSLRGIFIVGGPADNLIEGNLVSGNRFSGVNITDADRTLVKGNKIGTNLGGTSPIGNFGNGVVIDGGATDNVIGGADPGAGNLITGNYANGVWIGGPGTMGNVVRGNYIGTDVTGTTTTGPAGLNPENFTVTVVLDKTCLTYEAITDFDGFVSESAVSTDPWFGKSVHFKGTDECGSPETFGAASLIYRYKLEFDEPTELTSIALSGAAFNGPNSVLRVLDEDMNVLGTAYTFGGNSFQTPYVRLQGVVGTIFYVDEFDTSSTWRFRQSIVVNGSLPLGNVAPGVSIGDQASDNQIVGNLISGNRSDGIALFNSGTSSNILQGNLIGTDVSGNTALPNSGVGVWIGDGASNTIIGGNSSSERNVISGNNGDGVSINHSGTTGNVVQGNLIGTDVTGTFALGNSVRGVFIGGGASGNFLTSNLISGNGAAGIRLTDVGTEGNTIQGNLIGTDITGMNPLGNGYIGIRLTGGAANNMIGGTGPGSGNIIAYNSYSGITASGDAGSGNAFLSNLVFSNGGFGIDLSEDGITRNDPLDQDTGPNDLQNFPAITAVIRMDSAVTIQGLLASTPGTTFRLEFFSNETCNPSGFGEGEVFLGSADVKTNPAGIARFKITLPISLPQGAFVTATGTNPGGNTSEFSRCFTPAPGWNQINDNGFGDPTNVGVTALEVFQDQLYAGASNWETGGQVWHLGGDGLWSQVSVAGFGGGSANPAIIDLAVFQGQLYAGTGWDDTPGQVWRSPDGINWQPVTTNGFGNAENIAVTNFVVFKNMLYAGTGTTSGSAQIWRSSNGKSGTWKQVAPDGTGLTGNVTGFSVFKNTLYAAIEPAGGFGAPIQVWRSINGSDWTIVTVDGFGDGRNESTGGFAQFGGFLYLGTRNEETGAQLWRTSNGTNWEQVVGNGFGDLNNVKIESLLVFDNLLYAATYNLPMGMQLWRSVDGMSWEQGTADGFGDSNNFSTLWNSATVEYQGKILIGTWNNTEGGEVWMYTP